MTKSETEEFKKEMRELRDLIIRLDEKMNSTMASLKIGNDKFADHEERLRTIEEFKTEIRTKVVAYSSIISLLAGGIVAVIVKIL